MEPNFEKRGGVIVAIVQDEDSGQVLMQAYMNQQAWWATIWTGYVVLWSISKNELWPKGATSGNMMFVQRIKLDCDGDTVLLTVDVKGDGNACHKNVHSCFHYNICPKCGGNLQQEAHKFLTLAVHSGDDDLMWYCPECHYQGHWV